MATNTDYLICNEKLAEIAAELAGRKSALPPAVVGLLSDYATDGDNTRLGYTTFRHIDTFLATGEVAPRLWVAAGDFGYPLEELQRLRAAGKTGRRGGRPRRPGHPLIGHGRLVFSVIAHNYVYIQTWGVLRSRWRGLSARPTHSATRRANDIMPRPLQVSASRYKMAKRYLILSRAARRYSPTTVTIPNEGFGMPNHFCRVRFQGMIAKFGK